MTLLIIISNLLLHLPIPLGASQKDHVIVVLKFCVKKLILVPEIIEYYLATLLLYVICIYVYVLTL